MKLRLPLMAALLLLSTLLVVMAAPVKALSGTHPLVVVLCKFTDQQAEPHNVAYYQDLFSESGAGKRGVFDFWKDVSYGKLDLTGTVVKGWYTADKTVAEYNVLDRGSQIDVCASKADPDVDFSKFAGVVVLTNHTNFQGPLFGKEGPTEIGGTSYANLGRMAAEEDQHLSGIQHESGHSLGLKHSRTVSDDPNQSDYGDDYDVMSCFGNCYRTTSYSYQGTGGPGLNAVQVDTAGWIPDGRSVTLDTGTCAQQTVQMAALNHPEASGPLLARIPAAVPINKTFTQTTSDYYSVELRSKSGWDSGIPTDTFLVHLKGQDGYSYWVDAAGALTAGRQFVDGAHKTYVAVNSIAATPASTGVVTLGSCKLNVKLDYTGPTSGAYHDVVTLAADLKTDPGDAPVPNATAKLSLGSQSCLATTDKAGHASCGLRLDQTPGSYTVTASYAGSAAYNAQTSGKTFTIDRRRTALRYDGPSSMTNGSAATLQATLTESPGDPISNRTVNFTLGTGAAAQTCSGTTDAGGRAQCTIARVLQAGGSSGVQAAFAGDAFYLPSVASATVGVIKGATVLRYEGPANVANDFPATFRATLTQQDRAIPLENRTVSFTLGTGASAQTCSGTTNASGRAECTIPSVAQPAQATSVAVQAAFGGDAFFLPSGQSATLKLLYYSGRAYALATKVALLPPVVVSDTGAVSTASRSSVEKSVVSVSDPLVSASTLNASVTTGGGRSTAQARTQNLTVGIAGLPVIRAAMVRATSESVCGLGSFSASASGGVAIESLTIGGVAQSTVTVAPNTVIRVGTATITLNEQRPVPGSSAGMLVNAMHVAAPGVADVVISSAESAVRNCP